MPRILVLGSSNIDLVLRGDRLPRPGETVLGTEYFQAFGGKGANQAVAAARAGAEVTFLAAVGDDAFGKQAMDRYRNEDIKIDFIKTIPNTSTGVALILVDAAGQNMISVYPGANHSITPADIAALPQGLFVERDVFVSQLETPVETVRAAMARARAAGMITILNSAPIQPALESAAIFRNVDILIANELEIKELTGIDVHDHASAYEALIQTAKCLGPTNCVFTLGERGCIVAMATRPDRICHYPAIPVNVVDCVAAGDAFVGALACYLAQILARDPDKLWHSKYSLEEAAAWANHAAAISVTRLGAQPSLPYREEIDLSFRRAAV